MPTRKGAAAVEHVCECCQHGRHILLIAARAAGLAEDLCIAAHNMASKPSFMAFIHEHCILALVLDS